MEIDNATLPCVTCSRNNTTYQCAGCTQSFCFNHLHDHNQQLAGEMNDIESQRDTFNQSIRQYRQDASQHHPFLERINQWEANSIRLIQRTAQEAREAVGKSSTDYLERIEINLMKLTERMEDLKKQNDFNETHLNNWKTELDQLQTQVNQPDDTQIKEDSVLIKKITVIVTSKKPSSRLIDARWSPDAVTIAGANGQGLRLNQLDCARGIDIDHDQNIYLADYGNHRIIRWRKKSTIGRVVAGGNGQGNLNNQLKCPVNVVVDHQNDALIISDYSNRRVVRWSRQNHYLNGETIILGVACWGLTLNKNGDLYVVDHEKNEVRRWKVGEREGTLVAGGNGKGDDLNQLNQPRFVCLDKDESVYISDYGNHRVMKWTKGATEGVVVAGGQGNGSDLRQLSSPQGIFVDESESVYVVDGENDRVVRWPKGSQAGEIIVGGYGRGNQSNQLNRPVDLCFDHESNLYVVEYGNHRVQKFMIIGN